MRNKKQLKQLIRLISKYYNNLYVENVYVYYVLLYKFLSDCLIEYWKSALHISDNIEDYLRNRKNYSSLSNTALKELKYLIDPNYLFNTIYFRNNNASNMMAELIVGFEQVRDTANKYNNEFAEEFEILFNDLEEVFEIKQPQYFLSILNEIALLELDSNKYPFSKVFEEVIQWDSTNKITGYISANDRLSDLLSALIHSSNIPAKSAYDGFLGSGSLLFKVANNLSIPEIYGQEIQKEVCRIALMNMIVQEYSGKHYIQCTDTLSALKFENRFDVIVSDIPVLKNKLAPEAVESLKEHIGFNVPSTIKSSEWVSIINLFYSLSNKGIMAVMAPTSILSSNLKVDESIREYLVSRNYLDCIINLPSRVLSPSRIPVSILIFKKDRWNHDVLFINATNDFKANTKRKLHNVNIEDIVEVYSTRKVIPKLSNRADLNEIYDNYFNLNLARYVDTFDEEFISLPDSIKKLNELNEYFRKVDDDLNNKLKVITMTKEEITPKVFLSYARTNPEYANTIVEFANTLRGDGIDASIDEWDLKPGNDLYHFMESKIKSEADYVLLMINDEFTRKANERIGGVGAETQMMAKEVYDNVEQGRIIPIVWQCDDEGNIKLPTFVDTRYRIDLYSDEKFGENYELLLRTLFNKPKNPKTEIGKMPEWINDTNTHYTKTKTIIKRFDSAIDNHPERFNYFIEEFFDAYFEYIETFKIESSSNDKVTVSKEVLKSIEEYDALKNDLVAFLERMFKVSKYQNIDSEVIIDFLSNLRSFIGRGGQHPLANFDFILRETFLYLVAYALKYKNYTFIADLFYSPYYFDDYVFTGNESRHFVDLDMRGRIHTDDILSYSFKADNGNSFITPLGELLRRRVPPKLKQELLVDADLLCCYVSYMNKDKFGRKEWFPFTYIYKQNSSIEYFTRLTSKKYFDKVKEVYDVDSFDEFKEKVASTHDTSLARREVRFRKALGEYVEPVEAYIDLDKIGSER